MMRLLLNDFRMQNLWRCLMVFAMSILAVSVQARTGSSETFSIDLQSVVVTGQVTDESNKPLPGVNIIAKGTSNGTTSDAEGKFSLSIPSNNTILVFSFIGYTPQEIQVDNKSVIDVQLVADIQTLGELVVIGYGSQRKETVTGAMSTLKTQDIVKNDVADISNSLAGRLPGVIAVQSSAQPGNDAAQIFIRGQSTLNDNSPLVMVDGVQRDFNRIDPNQIESITVLKDAAATAVYLWSTRCKWCDLGHNKKRS
jgi:outer membrane receptor protein involved in Fe transport